MRSGKHVYHSSKICRSFTATIFEAFPAHLLRAGVERSLSPVFKGDGEGLGWTAGEKPAGVRPAGEESLANQR